MKNEGARWPSVVSELVILASCMWHHFAQPLIGVQKGDRVVFGDETFTYSMSVSNGHIQLDALQDVLLLKADALVFRFYF